MTRLPRASTERDVVFLRAFDWSPKPGLTLAFEPGAHVFVPLRCARAALAAGAARRSAEPAARLSKSLRRTR